MKSSGFSLIEVCVAIAILGLVILFVASLANFSHRETATDERLGGGIRANVFTSNALRERGFLELAQFCTTNNLFASSGLVLGCVNAARTEITTNLAAAGAPAPLLRVRINSAADADPEGKYCAEVQACRLLADGHLLVLNVVTSWVGVNQRTASTVHQIRLLR